MLTSKWLSSMCVWARWFVPGMLPHGAASSLTDRPSRHGVMAPHDGTEAGFGSHSCELFLACVFVSSRDAPTLAITTTDRNPSGNNRDFTV